MFGTISSIPGLIGNLIFAPVFFPLGALESWSFFLYLVPVGLQSHFIKIPCSNGSLGARRFLIAYSPCGSNMCFSWGESIYLQYTFDIYIIYLFIYVSYMGLRY